MIAIYLTNWWETFLAALFELGSGVAGTFAPMLGGGGGPRSSYRLVFSCLYRTVDQENTGRKEYRMVESVFGYFENIKSRFQ